MALHIQKTDHLPAINVAEIVWESQSCGIQSIQRLVDEWISGKNQFNQPGEAFFIAEWNDRPIGLCGLNRDPYTATAATGRVRRLYVLQACRRQGVGRALVEQVIATARPTFDWLHVRTDSLSADRFYCSLGFTPCADEIYVTHRLQLIPS